MFLSFQLLLTVLYQCVNICGSVKRKGNTWTDDKPAMLSPATRGYESIDLPNVLAIEGLEEESGAEQTMSQEDNDDKLEDVVCVESESDGKATSKKRKASKKLKSPRLVLSSNFELLVLQSLESCDGFFFPSIFKGYFLF